MVTLSYGHTELDEMVFELWLGSYTNLVLVLCGAVVAVVVVVAGVVGAVCYR